jgi:hypothetical protein
VIELPFIPGVLPSPPGPLGRFIPPVQAGVISTWLSQHVQPGEWVLDPFGASPRLAVEAARAGYRVLAASNNPIDRFLIDLVANPPSEIEFRSSLADLGAAQKGDQRVEPLLRNLYATACPSCQREVSADAFIWEKNAVAPKSRILHCPDCGESGEFLSTPADEHKLAQLPSQQLHRSRALERVTAMDDPDRALVEEALDIYVPRAIYALFTIINKLEFIPAHRRRPIFALLLAAFDQANTLWPHPTQRARPRQLTTPSQYRENNIWLAMENAIDAWLQAYPPRNERLPIVSWPEQPPQSGGISIFEGRVKDLVEDWPDKVVKDTTRPSIQIQAVITALPRPNQAYWTLSTLWSGWLWGREMAAPIKMVLHRRRYDWSWHCAALNAAFTQLKHFLKPGAALIGLIGEAEPGFLSAAILAAHLAGLSLEGMALRSAENQAQIEWRQSAQPRLAGVFDEKNRLAERLRDLIQQAGLEYLRRRGEPANYLEMFSAGLTHMISASLMGVESTTPADPHEEPSPADLHAAVNTSFQHAFNFPAGFVRFQSSSSSIEIGQWWLCESNNLANDRERATNRSGACQVITQTREIDPPLADRIEIEIVRLLLSHEDFSQSRLEFLLNDQFKGLFTPDPDLVQAILDSYAENIGTDEKLWRLRTQEAPRQRNNDIASISYLLHLIGARLGFESKQKDARRWITWRSSSGKLEYAFYPLASGVVGKLICDPEYSPGQSLLVYPGGRAALLREKLRRDPRLQSFTDQGWRFLKFRHVRRLAEFDQLSTQNLDEQLKLDPLANQDPQLSFI